MNITLNVEKITVDSLGYTRQISVDLEGVEKNEILDTIGKERIMDYFNLKEKDDETN